MDYSTVCVTLWSGTVMTSLVSADKVIDKIYNIQDMDSVFEITIDDTEYYHAEVDNDLYENEFDSEDLYEDEFDSDRY